MKTFIVSLLGLLVLVAGAASAEPGFSVGASAGYAKIEDSDSGFSFDASDTGYKLFGAYTFASNFGIEGGYIDFGAPSDNILGQTGEIDASGWNLYGVGTIPLSESFDIFAKAGMISWDADSRVDGVFVGSDDGNDLALGIGARLNAGRSLGIRSEFDWFDISDADSVWMLSVGVEFRF